MAALSTIALTALAGAAVASSAASLTKKPPPPPAPPTLPAAPDPMVEERKKRERARLAAEVQRQRVLGAYGRSDTLHTGPSGLTGAAPTSRATLGGG